MSPFSFSLSHSHCVSLYLFELHLSIESLSFLCFALSRTHIKMAEYGSLFQLSAQGQMAFIFFLFFFAVLACPTRLSQASLRGMADMKTFGSKLINEL